MKKLSFILPVYNVEPYLEKCIKSLRDKDMPYDEYEIIVINDGSPDNSEEIVRNLQKKIPNILLIDQENAGVSAARNKGIGNASGEYLVFIDPDDFVNPHLLKRLYDRAKKDELDILLCGRSIVDPNGQINHMVGYESLEDDIYDGVTAYYEKDKPFPVWDSSVGRLYRRSILESYGILFPVGVVHLEDGVFVRQIFAVSEKVGFENCDFYQVFERPGSASRSKIGISLKAALGDLKSSKDLLNFKKSHKLNASQLKLINTSIVKYTLLPLMRAVNAKDLGVLLKYKRLLVNEGIIPVNIDQVPTNDYLKYAKALNRSVWFFVLSYSFDMIKKSYKSKIS